MYGGEQSDNVSEKGELYRQNNGIIENHQAQIVFISLLS